MKKYSRLAHLGLVVAVVALVFTAGFAIGATRRSAGPFVSVMGKKITGKLAWSMVAGHIVGPVAPIATELGAKVRLGTGTGNPVLHITPFSPWLRVEHGPTFGTNPPYDFTELGPVMAVRHLLSERQWESYGGYATARPFLVRFEIIDAHNYTGMGDLPTRGEPSTVTAVLYWAALGMGTPRRGLRVVHTTWPKEQAGFEQEGPRPLDVRVDRVQFDVAPNDFRRDAGRVDISSRIPIKSAEAVIMGEDGWTVKGEQIISSKTIDISRRNNIVPLYDPSVQTFTKQMIEQGWMPHAY
jgi:hypothetical protein